MIINHNMSAINANNVMAKNQSQTAKVLEKLSSGMRINRAADDAAGLSISEKMRAQIRGLDQAARNSNEGIALIQTAEGALGEVHEMIKNMRDKLVQSANDTNTIEDRDALQKYVDSISSEVNRVGNTTEYNTMKLLNGGGVSISPTETTKGAVASSFSAGTTVTGFTATATAAAKATIAMSGSGTLTVTTDKGDAYKIKLTVLDTGDDQALGANVSATVTNGNEIEIKIQASGSHTLGSLATDIAAALNATGSGATALGTFSVTASTAGDTVTSASTTAAGAEIDSATTPAGTEQAGSATWKVTSAMAGSGSLSFTLNDGGGSVTFVLSAGTTNTTATFTKSANAAEQAKSIAEALNKAIKASTGISASFTAVASGDTFTIKENDRTQYGKSTTISMTPTNSAAVAGVYDVSFSGELKVGDKIDIDGTKITVVKGDDPADQTAINNGTAILFDDIAKSDIYTVLADAINTNTTLSTKYTAAVKPDTADPTKSVGITLTQNSGKESATAAQVKIEGAGFNAKLQIGANTGQSMTVQINDMRSLALGITVDGTGSNAKGAASGSYTFNYDNKSYTAKYVANASVTNGTDNENKEFSLDVSSHDNATAAVKVMDNALKAVSEERSKLGALQNRLEHTINNLSTTSENLTNAESGIRDTNMAKSMMEFTKFNILNQASQSMLAQANQLPQGVLSLLR